jgi:imidazole glycerol-phosphate synthase subunit HisH
MRVTLFDYGAGNLHSLSKAILLSAGVELRIETDPAEAVNADALILPGVGAFNSASERLLPGRVAMRDAILGGLPCLGICLGMQLLMDESEEGPGLGLGVIPGDVRKLKTKRVPQIGWNEIENASDPLFDQAPIAVGYFANSFVCKPIDESAAVAWSTHESERFISAVRLKNTVGVQFHPEKSSSAGLRFIRAFIDSARGPQ